MSFCARCPRTISLSRPSIPLTSPFTTAIAQGLRPTQSPRSSHRHGQLAIFCHCRVLIEHIFVFCRSQELPIPASRKRGPPSSSVTDAAQEVPLSHKRRRIDDWTDPSTPSRPSESSLSNNGLTESQQQLARKGKQTHTHHHHSSTSLDHQRFASAHASHHNSSSHPRDTPMDSQRSTPLAHSRAGSKEPLPKVEQPSPPSVFVQSAGPSRSPRNTPSTTWQSDATTSFSKRLAQSSSGPGQRTTPRKAPPSRLTLHGAADPMRHPPVVQSAPPIPRPGPSGHGYRQDALAQPLPAGTWLTDRNRGHQPSTPSGSHTHSHQPHILNDGPAYTAIRSSARQIYSAIPTPTSLRLGAGPSVGGPPAPPTLNPNPVSPSPYNTNSRPQIPPAAPSPLPILGSVGLADKAKFMQRMSEIYDRASGHRNCITADELDKRVREVTSGLSDEIASLRKELGTLRRMVPLQNHLGGDHVQEQDVSMASPTTGTNPSPPRTVILNGTDPTEGGAGESKQADPQARNASPEAQLGTRTAAEAGLPVTTNGRVAQPGKE